MPTILIAEDDPIQRRTVRRMVEGEFSANVLEASDGAEALLQLKSGTPIDLVLLDLQMPVMDGLAVLRNRQGAMQRCSFVVLTGSERVEDAVEAMRLGAVDFITKPPGPARLFASVRNALTLRTLQEEVSRLKHGRASHYSFADILAISPGLHDQIKFGQKAASSEIPVLITGESGVGKEVFAHAIHQESHRAEKPFVSVNCGALPENLVESILFGHEKGAFTGATAKALGKCREADTGVLFLDEVGELKPDAQVKLLRMLQEGEIEPVGAAKPVQVNVRVLSATNRSLEKMVAEGKFREDLYYRLHGLPLHLPPLRERRGDISLLAVRMLQRVASGNGASLKFSENALAWLQNYSWPGNVRELQHVISRAALLAENEIIETGDLARWARGVSGGVLPEKVPGAPLTLSLESMNGQLKPLHAIEQEVMEAALARYGGHTGRAAAALEIGQSTLYKRMRRT